MLLVSAVALTGCSASAPSTSASGSPGSPTGASASPGTAGRARYTIEVFHDVRYMSEPEGGKGTSLLDVYAPDGAGPWPVVVMCHGGGETKDGYEGWATRVARRGAVVFVPTWSRMDNDRAASLTAREFRAALRAAIGDIAAAVRFARGTAATYGGDPENLTLFGHSYGAMGATMEALRGAPAAEGSLEGAGSTIPESLVVFDGDYLLASFGDDLLTRDPGVMHVFTPWDHIDRPLDFPVTILDSVTPELSRDASDAWVEGSWLDTRDPSGDLRQSLEAMGVFDDDLYVNGDGMRLLADRMRADGDAVTYVTLTDSTHWKLGPQGMASLLDALVPDDQPQQLALHIARMSASPPTFVRNMLASTDVPLTPRADRRTLCAG
jgi:acetyl esterase/lipase